MLRGNDLILREWRESDLEALAVLRNDIELQTLLMSRARPNSIDTVRHWVVDKSSRDDTVFFVIAASTDDSVLGYLQVVNIDNFHNVGELGICLSPSAQGRNLAQEACWLLDKYLRHTFALRKLTLKVLESNVRAIAFYRKNGYREIGRLIQHFCINDQFQDVLIMERFLSK